MKYTLLTIAAIIGISAYGFAQQEELKSATTNIESQNYIAALDDLSKAKKKVTGLMTDQLASVLPQKFGEFEMQDNDGYGMDGQGAGLNKIYAMPKPEVTGDNVEDGMPDPASGMDPMMMQEQAQINVMVTTNMMMASEVMNAHSMADDGMSNEGVTALRIKGYRAILRTGGNMMGDMEQNSEEAHAIVGAAFIRVEARGMKEKGQAEKFLNLIDFDKLKGIVGE